MVRKFLYFVAGIAILVVAGGFVLNIWSRELTELALVPSTEFVEQDPLADNAYQDPEMWFSRPGKGTDDPARWQPALREGERAVPLPSEGDTPDFAVFFVHPTSFTERAAWNAPLDDEEANDRARLFIRGLASPFNRASEIWAPRYRQATVGAFLSDSEDAQSALDAAYADVAQSFAFFRDSVDEDTPIVIAGHSQGALHLLRLMREEIAGKPIADRVAAVYVVGWPISVERDLPELPFPACATPDQAGCILSWSTYAEPADPSDLLEAYSGSTGFDGQPRGESTILCTNLLTGGIGGSAPAVRNLGTLVPEDSLENGELVPSYVPARCDSRGLLLVGPPPEMGNYVLPGNNYHVYDIPLFWRNLQEDVVARVEAWQSPAA
ncbi:DUF3089 domain-containing protein [Erythrobacter litoralis]|uniref:DUF3089 domain-containing protein n=1 Tax=Erythrobacter litoralis (strain HTCC2594) TaxID=314225 RepID=Q2NCG0_ERYLH|nr:DUF3089 domain-containing protein [Erythrobacter litoralis]ABC62631.1 hypothetical protein ELI_02695 [Erythrobacter litoralis HTCC2594]